MIVRSLARSLSNSKMSKDQTEKQSSPNNDPIGDRDNMNLFTSVWVKVEVIDHDDLELKEDPEDPTTFGEQEKKRGPYKKCDPKPKHLKCDLCDYKTRHKNCLTYHILNHTNAKPFTCSHCDYKTKYPMSLKRHILVKHDDLITEKQELPAFKCGLCSYETHFKWDLRSHQRKHDLDKQFKCSLCSYSTAYKHSFIKHSRTHNRPENSTYNCDKCPFVTKYEGHITRHLAKIHFEVSEKASRCEHCTFSTKTRWRLNIHRKRSHQDKPIKCAHCDYQSMYRCAFKEHKLKHTEGIQNNHHWLESLLTSELQNVQNTKEGQAMEIMKMCEIKSKFDVPVTNPTESTEIYEKLTRQLNDDTYYTLNVNDRNQSLSNVSPQTEHEKNNHYLIDPECEVTWGNIQVTESPNQDRPFQCVMCNYRAKFKASVQRHYQRHHTSHNRPYKCLNCDFSTKTKDQITLHNKRSKSDEILTCKICGFTSVFKCQFMMHEKEHYPFKCVHCEYSCKKKPDMQKHFMTVHLGNGLKCSYCDFKAGRKESLLSHEAIHTGRKPFQCQLCEYTSVRRSLLVNHIHRFHKTRSVDLVDSHTSASNSF